MLAKNRRSHQSSSSDNFSNTLFRENLMHINLSSSPINSNPEIYLRYPCVFDLPTTSRESSCYVLQISRLDIIELKEPISVCLEKDEDTYIARCEDMPVFSYGDTFNEALDNLKTNFEELILELSEDDNYADEWLVIKKKLLSLIK